MKKITWDETFMAMVYVAAARSHDPRTKIGAVIATPDNMIVSMGYNGIPRGLEYNEDVMNSPEKYKIMCHGEENSILNSSRSGVSLVGCKIYVNLLPCNNCARMIIQSGITEVIVHKQSQDFYIESSDKEGSYWDEAFKSTSSMFSEMGMKLRFLDYQLVTQTGFFNGQKFPESSK